MKTEPAKLGIDPLVDFAFKKVFATEGIDGPLISLLNAYGRIPAPIEKIAIQNPFNRQEFQGEKVIHLDIKATDSNGILFNIEMQSTTPIGLDERAKYYSGFLFINQLKAGNNFTMLKPVYSIWILKKQYKNARKINEYRMLEIETHEEMGSSNPITYLQLDCYNVKESDLKNATILEKWVFWLSNAANYSREELIALLPEKPFVQATEILYQISQKKEDKQMYDAREKALLNHASDLAFAKEEGKKEGKREGIALGKRAGIDEGIALGKRAGIDEGIRLERINIIKNLQWSKKEKESTDEELQSLTLDELKAMMTDLQNKMRDR